MTTVLLACDLNKQSNNINAVPCRTVCRTKEEEEGELVHVICINNQVY